MTSDLVRRLREHPARYGGPTLKDGIWASMLEAADRLEAYEAGIAGINANIDNLNARYRDIEHENMMAARELDDLAERMQTIRSQTVDRDRERQRIMIMIGGLRQALQEIAAALPLSIKRTDPIVAQSIRPDKLTDTPEEAATLDRILYEGGITSLTREPEHFVYEQQTQDQPAQDAAAQPGGGSRDDAAPEGGAAGEPVSAQTKAPATT